MFVLVHIKGLKVKEAVLQSLKQTTTRCDITQSMMMMMMSASFQPIRAHLPDALQTVQHGEVEGAAPEGGVPAKRGHQLIK